MGIPRERCDSSQMILTETANLFTGTTMELFTGRSHYTRMIVALL